MDVTAAQMARIRERIASGMDDPLDLRGLRGGGGSDNVSRGSNGVLKLADDKSLNAVKEIYSQYILAAEEAISEALQCRWCREDTFKRTPMMDGKMFFFSGGGVIWYVFYKNGMVEGFKKAPPTHQHKAYLAARQYLGLQ